MSYVNRAFSVASGTPLVIPVNRWSMSSYTLQLTSSTAGTMLVEGTTQMVNRGETAVFATLDDIEDTALTALADPALVKLKNYPLEAIRLTASAGTLTGTLMQSGDNS